MLLTLKNDIESVDFIDTVDTGAGACYLVDGSFSAPPPKPLVGGNAAQTRAAQARQASKVAYENRTVTFSCLVKADTSEKVANLVEKIYRIISMASQYRYISGGQSYAQQSPVSGTNTGDHGVVLIVRFGGQSSFSITTETGVSSVDSRKYTFRVIRGSVNVEESFSAFSSHPASVRKQIEISLECEPFAIGDSRVIVNTASPGYYSGKTSPETSNENRIYISGSSIPGSVPALTRITTQIYGGTGIVIGRDYGNSLLNMPSAPKLLSGVGAQMDCIFAEKTAWLGSSGNKYTIKISSAGSPNQFQYKVGSGSYSVAQNIVAHQKYPIAGQDTSIWFAKSTGFVLNDEFTINNNQTSIRVDASVNVLSNKTTFLQESGYSVASFYVNVPPGCRGRYKILGSVTGSSNLEYRYSIRTSGYEFSSIETFSNWRKFEPVSDVMVELGILDLSSRGDPSLSHPSGHTKKQITVYCRLLNDITSAQTFTLPVVYLIPCDDEDSYLIAGWRVDESGFEIYSNYDPEFPYIAEASRSYIDGQTAFGMNITTLDYTKEGNPITLIPGVDNTLIIFPIFHGSTNDYKLFRIPDGGSYTGNTTVSIRPRYLFVS